MIVCLCLGIIPLIVKNILPRIHLMRKSAYPFWFNPSSSGYIMIDPAPFIDVQWLPYLDLRCSLATLSIKESSHNFLALGGCRSVAHSKWPCFFNSTPAIEPMVNSPALLTGDGVFLSNLILLIDQWWGCATVDRIVLNKPVGSSSHNSFPNFFQWRMVEVDGSKGHIT